MEKLTNEKLLWALGRWFSSNHSPETKINLTHSGKSRPMSVYEIGGELARMAREIKESSPVSELKNPIAEYLGRNNDGTRRSVSELKPCEHKNWKIHEYLSGDRCKHCNDCGSLFPLT